VAIFRLSFRANWPPGNYFICLITGRVRQPSDFRDCCIEFSIVQDSVRLADLEGIIPIEIRVVQ